MLSKLKLSIGGKLTWVALLGTIPVLIIVGFVLGNQQKNLLLTTVNASLDNTLNYAKDAIFQDFYHLQNEVKSIATDPKLRRALDLASNRGVSSRLNYIAKIRPEVNYLLLIDESETVFAATTSNYDSEAMGTEAFLGSSITNHPLYLNLPAKDAAISAPGKDPFLLAIGQADTYSQWIIAPVIVRGKTLGWVILSYKFEQTLSTFLQQLIDRLQKLEYAVLSSSILNDQQQLLATTKANTTIGLTRSVNMVLGGSNVQLEVIFDQEKVFSPLVKQQQTTFIAFVVLITTLCLFIYLAVKRILINRLNVLNKTVSKFADGELSHRVSISGADELNILGTTFNTMAAQISHAHEYLEAQVAFRTKELNESAKQLADKHEKLEKYASELERSNKELNDFAYVASHDLKAPLRGIVQLVNWIEEDLEETLEEQTKEYLDLMQNRVTRLEKLLDDLLSYSRVGRRHGDFVNVNITTLTQDIFQLLDPPDSFTLECQGEDLSIVTLSVPLEQILRNLINNAIKHHDRETGVITLTVTSTADEIYFEVADDGPGIAPEQHERVFEIFQTLKPRDEVEGSGMGLAIIRKLLDTYHSRIWVESQGQGGTKMCFTWPKEHVLRTFIND